MLAAAALGSLLIGVAVGVYLYRVDQQYNKTKATADQLQTQLDGDDALNPDNLPGLASDLGTLERDLRDLKGSLDTPVLGGIVKNTPFVSKQVKASEALIDLGIELTAIAREATEIADEARTALETTGLRYEAGQTGPTWLDILREHRSDIDDLQLRFDQALLQRQQISEADLPERGKRTLANLDQLLERASQVRNDYAALIPLLDSAFGAESDATYLILLQNTLEMRPSGGFFGMYALVTLRDGQILEYDIDNVRELDFAYVENRTEVLDSPAPIAEYTEQLEWLPHDANWSPEFSEAAQAVLQMYEQAGWPTLTGILAVNYGAVVNVLDIVGPVDVEVEGETETITADTIVEFIEGFRDGYRHKPVIRELGNQLIDKALDSDFATKKEVFFAARDDADAREIQVYMLDPVMQAEVAKRNWDGKLVPDPELPTLAMTVASVVGGKTSDKIEARTDLTLSGQEGISWVTWDIRLEHSGDPDGPEKTNGLHGTWLSVYLPEGAVLTNTSLEPAPPEINDDPRSISFFVPILPTEVEHVVVEFELPEPTEMLYLRKQSGFNVVRNYVTVDAGSCALTEWARLDQDLVVDTGTCSIVRGF